MSVADTIDRAAAGELPDWACVRPARRAHMARVAALMDGWAAALGLSAAERARWRAAGWLHDALRDAHPDRLRPIVPESERTLPPGLLHGPAAAARLADDGVDDEALLVAVAYHTTGHPTFAGSGGTGDADRRRGGGTGGHAADGGHESPGRIGRFLYMADYLEPGRSFDPVSRAVLRARLPAAADAVLHDVARRRMAHLVARARALPGPTVRFWNALAGGSA